MPYLHFFKALGRFESSERKISYWINRNFWLSHAQTVIPVFIALLIFAARLPAADSTVNETLSTLARRHFGKNASRQAQIAFDSFFKAIEQGKEADFTPPIDEDKDPQMAKILTEPVYAELWGKERVVKAEWLTWLFKDPQALSKVTSVGIELVGARIEGEVDLTSAKVSFPLQAFKCSFRDDIKLNRAKVGALELQGTSVRKLEADSVTTDGDVFLSDGFRAQGVVWFRNATINGSLICTGGQFFNEANTALSLEGAKVGPVALQDGFEAHGEVTFFTAIVNGTVSCRTGRFVNPGQTALDLEGITSTAVIFGDKFFSDGAVNLDYAAISAVISCDNGQFCNQDDIAIDLRGTRAGSVRLEKSFFHGNVVMTNTTIGGNVSFDGSQLLDPDETAVDLEDAKTGSLSMRSVFVQGGTDLHNATVSGTLECTGSRFTNPNEVAINAQGLTTTAVHLNPTNVEGQVDLAYCVMGGVLDCENATFRNADGTALDLEAAKVGPVRLQHAQVDGEVNMLNATVGGDLECSGGRFSQSYGTALNLEGAKTDSVYLRNGFAASGMVNLLAATVAGDLICNDSRFSQPHDSALVLNRSKVGSVSLDNSSIEGMVSIANATISGFLSCRHCTIKSGEQMSRDKQIMALFVESSQIDGSIFLIEGFRAEGKVDLYSANIGGNLECIGGHFINPNGNAIVGRSAKIHGSVFMLNNFEACGIVNFEHAEVDGDFDVEQIKSPNLCKWNLKSAKVKNLVNDRRSWPDQNKLLLEGLVFTEMAAHEELNSERQIHWLQLERQDRFVSQPYEQTAEVFRSMGLQDDAVKILIAKNLQAGGFTIVSNLRSAYGYGFKFLELEAWEVLKGAQYLWKMFWALCKALWAAAWYWGFGFLIGYGYWPWRALLPSIVIVIIGQWFFKNGYENGMITPTKGDAWVTDTAGRKMRLKEDFPQFSSLIYSIEKFVPLLKLDLGDYWTPNTNYREGRALRRYLWFHIIAGWVLTSLWAASLTGLLKS